MDPEAKRQMIRQILDASKIPQAQLAAEAGISYASLHAWLTGLRTPSATSLRKLADALERHGERLQTLAKELRKHV